MSTVGDIQKGCVRMCAHVCTGVLSEIELFTVVYRYRLTWFPLSAFEFGLLEFDASVISMFC